MAEGGDAGDVRRGGAKGGDGGGNVGAARLETAVATVAVADTAAVETKDGMACRGDPLAEHRHAAVRAAADLVAARNDQQPGRSGRFIKGRGERRALASEGQMMPHERLHAAISAAIRQGARRVGTTCVSTCS